MYLYVYSYENPDPVNEYYPFMRITYEKSQFVSQAFSDNLRNWETQTSEEPRIPWNLRKKYQVFDVFLSAPTTIVCRSIKELRTKYPELLL